MAGESLWDLHKEFAGLPADTELPTVLDAHRAHTDGLAHCQRCGGVHFTATVILSADGAPASMLTPQTCIGCGALRQATWQS